MKTHLLLKIVPTILLFGTTAFAATDTQRFVTDSNGNIYEAPVAPKNTLAPVASRDTTTPSHRGNTSVQQAVDNIVADAKKSSSKIAQLTAEYAAANPKSAADVIAGVEKATGIRGDYLAAAVGREFQKNPELAAQTPEIALALVTAILAKGSTVQIQGEIAETVAILVTSLPGQTQSNQETIAKVGHSVSSALSGHPEVAAEVVGITASVLKTSSGNSDVAGAIKSFADSFKTDNTAFNTKLDAIVTNANAGQVYNALPTSTSIINTTNGNTTTTSSGLSAGAVTTPETTNQNG
ncbi:MAG: hypothetical protein ACFUZC_00665 [Chthoniobacteraceae bacterium]